VQCLRSDGDIVPRVGLLVEQLKDVAPKVIEQDHQLSNLAQRHEDHARQVRELKDAHDKHARLVRDLSSGSSRSSPPDRLSGTVSDQVHALATRLSGVVQDVEAAAACGWDSGAGGADFAQDLEILGSNLRDQVSRLDSSLAIVAQKAEGTAVSLENVDHRVVATESQINTCTGSLDTLQAELRSVLQALEAQQRSLVTSGPETTPDREDANKRLAELENALEKCLAERGAASGDDSASEDLLQLAKEVRQDEENERGAHRKLLERIDELCDRITVVDAVVLSVTNGGANGFGESNLESIVNRIEGSQLKSDELQEKLSGKVAAMSDMLEAIANTVGEGDLDN